MNSTPVVIDTGSGFTKVGFAGYYEPKVEFPTVVGVPKDSTALIGGKNVDFFVGNEVFTKSDLVDISKPIENGVIVNWDDIEKVWHHTYYNELLVVPDQHPVIITEKQCATQHAREKTIQMFFETFNVPGYYSGVQSVFALLSCGLTTGIVWDGGEGYSSVVPVYEGYQQPHAVLQSPICGEVLTKFFTDKLNAAGTDTSFLKPNDIAGLKENKCRVNRKIDENRAKTSQSLKRRKIFQKELHSQNESEAEADYDTAEVLFNPSIAQLSTPSIPETIVQSLLLVDTAVRYEMLPNVVLSGGCSMFSGLPERMESEIIGIDIKPLLQPGETLPPPKRRTHGETSIQNNSSLQSSSLQASSMQAAVKGQKISAKNSGFLGEKQQAQFSLDDDSLALTPEELHSMSPEEMLDLIDPNIKNDKNYKVPKLEDMIIPDPIDLRLKIPGDFLPPSQKYGLPLTNETLLLTENGYIIPYERYKCLIQYQKARKVKVPVGLNAHVTAPPERKNSVWIGGSVLGSLDQFPDLLISKEEYKETGSWIVQMKCYS
ncbi:Actin family protein [Trichomonas vaginalis G3]|uniref:Actin family protein n=1 Tax=Trichomonas vaginalis (strain ATCC PRA-98 / G3) TaxID=412133 RepID=A2FRF9_TRIV3|nr:ATP binding [Trichomonas vaginalis G3]EAX92523.1 Actin family protein [Trichomonas vaginalis G3]KAI5540790.1 ATP binding [Trichomonas vaginalis G3]|eukprot:XP_001305453.1 Actin family protein [Trichomonas vaginalis G3]